MSQALSLQEYWGKRCYAVLQDERAGVTKNKTKLRDQRSCRCCHVGVLAWRLAWASDAGILKAFAIHESLPQRSRLIAVARGHNDRKGVVLDCYRVLS